MSRQQPRYHPAPNPTAVPRSYFMTEDGADYSDTEMDPSMMYHMWNERAPGHQGPLMHENMVAGTSSDVTELFRRKPEDHYVISQEVVMPEDTPRYYYRPAALARLPQRRLPLASVQSQHPSASGATMPPQAMYYPPPHEEPRGTHVMQPGFDGVVFRSSPHLHRSLSPSSAGVLRGTHLVAESSPQVTNIVRAVRPPSKPAVTVRTPRYYRRAGVYKRPSTLCIPLTSEPDPAIQSHSHNTRPVKSRLPSTMPGVTLLSPALVHHTHPNGQHQNTIMGPHTQEAMAHIRDERVRKKQVLPPRSAPPTCNAEMSHMLKEAELEKIQQMILEQRGIQDKEINEFGDDEICNLDAEPRTSELELLLAQYQQIFSSESSSRPRSSTKSATGKNRIKSKKSFNRLSVGQLLKPRLPPSLKALQKHATSKSSIKSTKQVQDSETSAAEEDRTEIEQMTADVLDSLLQDLNAGGLAGTKKVEAENETAEPQPQSRPCTRAASARRNQSVENNEAQNENPDDVILKSSSKNLSTKHSNNFNYNDIKQFIEESTASKDAENFNEIPTKTTFIQDKEKFTQFSNSSHTSFEQDKSNRLDLLPTIKPTSSSCTSEDDKRKFPSFKPEMNEDSGKKSSWSAMKNSGMKICDDHTALELHKSKSYIVNLIDRALSRELGTIPEERPAKQYANLDARTAMDLMSSPAAKNLDNDLCLEISQALAESFNNTTNQESNALGTQAPCCSSTVPECSRGEPIKNDGELLFSTGTEEPLYIKQLKKLRWGHLKHIQREMRRLEDLERFLDSCTSEK